MKKFSILASLVVLVASAACTVKEQDEVLPSLPQAEEFYATIEQPSESETKTFADDQFRVLWHADDRITIFNRYTYNQEYAFQGETGDNAGGFSKVGDEEFVTGNDLPDIYAVYPFQKGTKISNDGIVTVTLPSEQTWAEGSFGAGSNTMISVTTDNKLKFRNTGSILSFKLYGDNVQVSKITLQGNKSERIAGKASVTMPVGGTPSVAMQSDASQSITLNCEPPVTIGSSADSYTEFWFVVPPTNFTNGFTITVTCSDGSTYEKKTDKSISLERNHIYRMAPIEVIPEKPVAEPEYVDLGLPSGLKWATFNVGATKPEEYGEYFAWGETEPKSDYRELTYKWDNGDYYKLTKYCTDSSLWDSSSSMDNKTVLDPEDDAAHVNWGGSWRMPTDAEWTELRTECTWTWTTQNGVNGRLVTGPNGKSIFLPAAGYRSGSNLYDAGSYGTYWSSSLNSDKPYRAWGVGFYSDDVFRSDYFREGGISVRPVSGEFIPVSSISMDKTSMELNSGDPQRLTATISPSNATAKDVHWSSSDNTVATVDENGIVTAVAKGTVTITAYGSSGVSAECIVTVEPDLSLPASVEAIDLGLPSGIKWASMNVGATSPEGYGFFFAWGETEPKYDNSWSSYKWCNGAEDKLTKYCTNSSLWDSSSTMDNKTVLDPEDDVAHVNWGGSWRMPTDEECEELINNCTWTWTSQNGVNGRLVTGTNGKSIFLPAAGYRLDASRNDAGFLGLYWSSSLLADRPDVAWLVFFLSDTVDRGYGSRYYGQSIRPVSE